MNRKVTIWHLPRCSTSRSVLQALTDSGYETTVRNYLEKPPSEEKILSWITAGTVTIETLFRKKEPVAKELGISSESLSAEQLAALIQTHPVLMERPVLESDRGVWVARPRELFEQKIRKGEI
ncbi:MAG: arsenate reductase (glutaredoxin) [Bacteroidetes bacterium]|nr:arsenate reductase (glutaredoxin) [Bacteroidota bacterium]